ncbi:hypothetical protein HDU85_004891 [Gaertneriomyces sp. JEL0708]|nr:hypothetical protein HDU85_004891 [Gaertneriomyces sp. JEL0708]
MSTSTVGVLPEDCIIEVLKFLDAATIAKLCRISKTWARLCSDNLLWKELVRLEGWKHWRTRPNHPPSWKEVYRHRKMTDRRILDLLDECIASSVNRLPRMSDITSFLEDAIDILREQCEDAERNDYICRRYYARRLLRSIGRRVTAREWERVLAMPEDQVPLEYGAMLISKFVNLEVEYEDVDRQLNELAVEAKAHVMAPDSDEAKTYDGSVIERRARQLYDFLFVSKRFHGAVPDYYNVRNSLIDKVLERRTGLPITLALLYHAVGRRLGLTIDMISFPQHFLARVVTEDGTPWFVDCFRHQALPQLEPPFRSRQDCLTLLGEMGLRFNEEFLEPATSRALYTRMASNILSGVHGVQRDQELVHIYWYAYGAVVVKLLLEPSLSDATTSYRRMLYSLIRTEYPEDLWFAEADLLKLRQVVNSNNAMQWKETLRARLECQLVEDVILGIKSENDPHKLPSVKHRSPERPSNPKFRVGQLITHARYNYVGVIYGWDYTCLADEEWITSMGVDYLSSGRDQPFYNVYALSGPSRMSNTRRYVAEQNITTGNEDVRPFLEEEELGQWFMKWDEDKQIFTMAPDCARQYPDDM